MKLDFYFIHGWGFDKTFWEPVCKKIKGNEFTRVAKSIDLGFFSRDLFDNYIQKYHSKSIFVVHSYGLNWLLKNQIKCSTIINFFGVPSFLGFQKNPHVTKKKINRMIENFSENPQGVLNDFYNKCNIEYIVNKKANVVRCLKSLKELKDNDFTKSFNNLSCQVYSIFSLGDNVIKLNKKNLNILRNKNHDIKFVNGIDHGFPRNNPELCYKMIKKILIELGYESI